MTARGEIREVDPFVGHLIDGRFDVQALLGVGSVGSVYRAHDRVRDRVVALKLWNASAYNEQTRGRFIREAKALATLRHPNIVNVYGYGTFDALPYVAMEFLDGQTVEALLANRQPLETELAFDVMTQMLQALAYAHALGVVHRDLKPDNVVLVTGSGSGKRVVKLLDYGLAKFLSPDDDPTYGSTLTITGMVMGTPLYMPPEQAAGKTVDVRVDVYAAGCLLYEVLTGQPPYSGETNGELIRLHMTADIPRLATLRPDLEAVPALQAMLDKALAKKPEERYADAAEMFEALQALPESLVHPSRASTRPQRQDERAGRPSSGPDRMPLIAAVITGLCTAAALAYALLR